MDKKIRVVNLSSNLLKKPKKQGFKKQKRLNWLYFQVPKGSVFAIIFLSILTLMGSAYFGYTFLIKNGEQAQASQTGTSLLDEGFANQGRLPLIQKEGYIFNDPLILENGESGFYGVATATLQSNTNITAIGIFSLNASGQTTQTIAGGSKIIAEPSGNIPLSPIKALLFKESIYILSQANTCFNPTPECTGRDVFITKHGLDGDLDLSFGKQGIFQENFSKEKSFAKEGERVNTPTDFYIGNSGNIFVSVEYFYPQDNFYKKGLNIFKLNNQGSLDSGFAVNGQLEINEKTFPEIDEINNVSDKEIREGRLVFNSENLVYNFSIGNRVFAELSFSDQGQIISQQNNQRLIIFNVDDSLIQGDVSLKSFKMIDKKILIYGFCRKTGDVWTAFCVLKMLPDGNLDPNFLPETKNTLTLPYSETKNLPDNQPFSIIQDINNKQVLLSLRTNNTGENKIKSELILIKEDGKINKFFAEDGIWKLPGVMQGITFLNNGKAFTQDNEIIYLLNKPTFTDPIISKITPSTASQKGGLSTVIEGNNFLQTQAISTADNIFEFASQENPDAIISNKKVINSPDRGSFYVGEFKQRISIGNFTIVGEDEFLDGYVSKINANNEVLWAIPVGGDDGDDIILDAQVDRSGNLYIAGQTKSDGKYFGKKGGQISSQDKIFIAAYNPSGGLMWHYILGGQGENEAVGLAVYENEVILVGNFQRSLDIEGFNFISPNQQGFYLALNLEGKVNSAKVFQSQSQSKVLGIKKGKDQEMVIYGEFNQNLKLDESGLTSNGSKDIFIVKISSQKIVNWIKNIGSNGSDLVIDCTISDLGEVYFSGLYAGDIRPGLNLSSGGFISKIDREGNIVWSQPGYGKLEMLPNSNVLVYTDFANETVFGNQKSMGIGKIDIFLGVLDTNGNPLWSQVFGSPEGNETIKKIKVDEKGDIYFGGSFENNSKFEDILISSNGLSDVYLGKINQYGDFRWIQHLGGKELDSLSDINIKEGKIKLVGNFKDIIKLNDTEFGTATNSLILSFDVNDNDLSVFFGEVQAKEIDILNNQQIRVVVPPNAEGFVNIKVNRGGSSSVLYKAFFYEISVNINLEEGLPENPFEKQPNLSTV
jgi:hypothetical protein